MKKKIKVYNYLVYFSHKYGTGSAIIPFKKKISSIDHLDKIKKYIEKNSKGENIAIATYQLINTEKKIKEEE